MKKFSKLLTLLLLLAFFVGCGEDPINPVTPPKELSYKIEPMYDTVLSGSKVQIKIVSNADSISADFPEVKTFCSPINTTIESQPITQTTIYHIAFYINGKVVDIANPTYVVRKILLPPPPTVTVSANPYTVIRGKTTVVSWNISGEVDSIKSNLPDVSTKGLSSNFGSITLMPQESRLITVTAYGKGGITSDTAIITVIDPPPPTNEELLANYGPWKKIKLEGQDASGLPWDPYDIWDCMQDNLYYFYLTPTKKMVNDRGVITCSEDENRTSEGPWSLSGNIIIGLDCEILTLTRDTLVWVYVSGGGPGRVRETFVHP
jgi:hypothetical protein